MTKQVRNEVVESQLVDIKSAVICNEINHVDDTVNVLCIYIYIYIFMLLVLLRVGLRRSVGRCGDLSIRGRSA